MREGSIEAAVGMIARLSDFLRRVLEDSTRQQVPLAEELDFARQYLDIQKLRFVDRLQVSIEVALELHRARVPFLILQPLVENAFKHGIAKRTQGGSIQIRGTRLNDRLELSVYNDGPHLGADDSRTGSGIGLPNLHARLQGLYGRAFALTLQNRDPGGVEVCVSLPFEV